jgi:hypothetical protein
MAKFKVYDLMVLLEAAWDDEVGKRPHERAPRTICPNSLDRPICPNSLGLCKVSVLVENLASVDRDDLVVLKKQLAEVLEVVAKREFELRDTVSRLDPDAADAISDALDKSR